MNSGTLNIEVVGNQICELGEGPVWDEKNNIIYWLDIVNGKIFGFDVINKIQSIIETNQMVGSIVIATNGNIIAALKNGIYRINRQTGHFDLILQIERHLENNRFNDGKCDALGRFWVGTMSLTEEKNAGSLYAIGINSLNQICSKKMISNLTISNGIAWSLNGKILYFIDTPTREVVAYDFEIINGSIKNKRCIIKFEESDGYPDGMTIDSDGMLWIAHWNGWQVSRWNTITGKKIFSIKLPVANITSCTFGGEKLNDLYITSANINLTYSDQVQQPLAGSLFKIENCGFKGIAAFQFYNI